jgi:hypothetical protein
VQGGVESGRRLAAGVGECSGPPLAHLTLALSRNPNPSEQGSVVYSAGLSYSDVVRR